MPRNPTPLDEPARKQVQTLLTSALEGGSNYWYAIEGVELPKGFTHEDFKQGGKFNDPEDYNTSYVLIAIYPRHGCNVLFSDVDNYSDIDKTIWSLNLKAIHRGLALIQSPKYQRHWAEVLRENDDAETGDVFLQLCLFGEVVYG